MSDRIDHAAEAVRLMNKSKGLRRAANNPDAAGSGIRAGWRRQADELMAEANVHAAFAAALGIGGETNG